MPDWPGLLPDFPIFSRIQPGFSIRSRHGLLEHIVLVCFIRLDGSKVLENNVSMWAFGWHRYPGKSHSSLHSFARLRSGSVVRIGVETVMEIRASVDDSHFDERAGNYLYDIKSRSG